MEAQNINKPPADDNNSESSQWSLKSLEDLKGLNLSQMKEDDENDNKPPGSYHPKTQRQVEITYPPKQKVMEDTQLFEIGKIVFKVGQIFVVQASSSERIVDLNNCLFDKSKNCAGFVMDVFGRVDNPFYALKQYPAQQQIDTISLQIGSIMCYAQGCKTLTQQDIKSLQDKNFVECQVENSSSDQSDQGQQISQKQPLKKHFNFNNNRQRKTSFEERPRYRERTRQNKGRKFTNNNVNNYSNTYGNNYNNNNNNNNGNQRSNMPPNNQQYLNNLYAMHYQQMMQMQNGNGQFMTPPPSNGQFVNHPPFPSNGQFVNPPPPPTGQFMTHPPNPFFPQNQNQNPPK